jgi:hypothetical protein
MYVARKIACGSRERRLWQRRVTGDATIHGGLCRTVDRKRGEKANRNRDWSKAYDEHAGHDDT